MKSKKSKQGAKIKSLDVSRAKASKVRGGTVSVRPPDGVAAIERMVGEAVSVDVRVPKPKDLTVPNPAPQPPIR